MNLQEQFQNLTTKSEFTTNNLPDLISLALHHAVAFRLRSNPHLIQKAKSNLNGWLSKNPNVQAWLEWQTILENESLKSVLEIITAETDEGQRLRSSSPFVGLITKEERKAIIDYCEKAKPF